MELGGATLTADCWQWKAANQSKGSWRCLLLCPDWKKDFKHLQGHKEMATGAQPSPFSATLLSLKTVSSEPASKPDSQSPGCCSILYLKCGSIQQIDAQGWGGGGGAVTKGLSAFWPLQRAPEAGWLTNHGHPLLTVLAYPLHFASTGE